MRLSYDPRVLEAVADHAAETGVPGSVAFEEARRYAREIVPGFSATLYFGVAIRLARWLSRLALPGADWQGRCGAWRISTRRPR